MNFRQFFELSDLVNRDTSGIQFNKEVIQKFDLDEPLFSYDKYTSSFDVGGDNFTVEISSWSSSLVSSGIDFVQSLRDLGASNEELLGYFENVYHLAFKGPRGYGATHSNISAPSVYSNVLLVIKKFMSDHLVEGLVFSPYDEAMALVYNRFLRNFSDFVVVDSINGIYLNKDLISRIVSKYPMMSKMISMSGESYQKELDNFRKNKSNDRQKVLLARNLMNKIVAFKFWDSFKVGLVYGYDRRLDKLLVSSLSNSDIDRRYIDFDLVHRLSDHPELRDDYSLLDDALRGKFPDYSVYDGALPSDS